MCDAKIKTSAATFSVNGITETEARNNNVTIGSDGKIITAAKYQIESSTGNITANNGANFFNSDKNKNFTVNGVTYTTDKFLCVIATADSSKIYGGYVDITSGKNFTDYNGKNIFVTGDNDGVTVNIDCDNDAYFAAVESNPQTNYENFFTVTKIEGLDESATLTYGEKTFTRNGNFIFKAEGNAKTIFECYENSAYVLKVGYSYVKVTDNVIDLTGDKDSAIYGTSDDYESGTYLAKVEKFDDNSLTLNKNDKLTDALEVTIDDGKL